MISNEDAEILEDSFQEELNDLVEKYNKQGLCIEKIEIKYGDSFK